MKKLKNTKRKGITLIVVTSIMLVLSTTAITFVRLANYDRKAANSYIDDIDAKLTAFSGLDHAIALIYDNIRNKGRIGFTELVNNSTIQYPEASDRDLFAASQGSEDISLQRDVALYEDGSGIFSYSGNVGRRKIGTDVFIGSHEQDGNFYSLKIEDNSGKLNINSHTASNGSINVKSNAVLNRILVTLAKECGFDDTVSGTLAEILSPIGNPGSRIFFEDIEQLDDFLRAAPGLNFTGDPADKFIQNVTTDSFIDSKTVRIDDGFTRDLNEAPKYVIEERAPVNINTASKELIKAIISNIKTTATFFANDADLDPEKDVTFGDNNNAFDTENKLKNLIAVYLIDFSVDGFAERIASEIIAARNNGSIFPLLDQGDVDEFFKNIPSDAFSSIPVPTIAEALNTGFLQGVLQLSGDDSDTVISPIAWEEALRDTLKSQSNPNVVDNFFNPNSDAHKRICKGDFLIGNEPTHTTEFSTFSVGSVNITSLGRVTAEKGKQVLGIATVSTIADFGRQITQTTQRDFLNQAGTISTTGTEPFVTAPENTKLQKNIYNIANTDLGDEFAGIVEPRPFINNPTIQVNGPNNNVALFYSGETFVKNGVYNNTDGKYNQAPAHWQNAGVNNQKLLSYNGVASLPEIVRGSTTVRDPLNNIAYDGLLSRKAFYSPGVGSTSVPKERYFVEANYDRNTFVGNGAIANYFSNRTSAQPVLRNDNTPTTQVGNFKGSLQFWVKFDADIRDAVSPEEQVTFGLIGATSASGFRNGRIFAGIDTNFREGVQMFVYMNSLGKLRVSRLYYGLCYKFESPDGLPYGVMFDTDADLNRKNARRDAVFDNAKNFKAHEWYHIRVTWDDNDANQNSMGLFINGEKVAGAGANNLEIVDVPNTDREWGLLNEKEPIDSFYINGFPRQQFIPGGYFHFDRDVHFVGNATIDEVISSEKENFPSTHLQKFNLGVTYTNQFNLAADDDLVTSVHWTSYPPFRQDANEPQARISNVKLGNVSKAVNDSLIEELGTIKREIFVLEKNNTFTNITKDDSNPTLEYTVQFTSIDGETDMTADEIRGARCASLDSVTITTLRKFPILKNTKLN